MVLEQLGQALREKLGPDGQALRVELEQHGQALKGGTCLLYTSDAADDC